MFNDYMWQIYLNSGGKNIVSLFEKNLTEHLSKKYIAKGNITVEELEDLQRMWDCYHDPDRLDGNGYLDKLMSAVHRLSIVNSSND